MIAGTFASVPHDRGLPEQPTDLKGLIIQSMLE
jgi:hypothetical protein